MNRDLHIIWPKCFYLFLLYIKPIPREQWTLWGNSADHCATVLPPKLAYWCVYCPIYTDMKTFLKNNLMLKKMFGVIYNYSWCHFRQSCCWTVKYHASVTYLCCVWLPHLRIHLNQCMYISWYVLISEFFTAYFWTGIDPVTKKSSPFSHFRACYPQIFDFFVQKVKIDL